MQLQVKLRLPQCVVPSTDEYPHTCMLWCTNRAVCMCMPWAMLASGQKRASASIGQTRAGSSILSAPALTTARPSGSIFAFGPLTGHEREGIEVKGPAGQQTDTHSRMHCLYDLYSYVSVAVCFLLWHGTNVYMCRAYQ